ncbi:MAG: NADAR family protein [Burkholderiales bacterium]|uniref:NADAR family protein n=1 Tax=Roseateles sp. TaxID=1971397 RepID=UPI000FBB1A8D|nr:MAG: NADAR family protein [Burkholderiales bacterium]
MSNEPPGITNEPLYFYTRAMPYWGLSNFAPPGIEVDGIFWPTVEHYFQAQKFDATDMQERIRRAPTPKQARELGQTRSRPIRVDWDTVREAVMLRALRLKFSAPDARRLLLSTGARHLVESSPYDYFWGAGQDGTGLNRLGHLLMQVRAELRSVAT